MVGVSKKKADILRDPTMPVVRVHLGLHVERIHGTCRQCGNAISVEAGTTPDVENVLVAGEVEQPPQVLSAGLSEQPSLIIQAVGAVGVETRAVHQQEVKQGRGANLTPSSEPVLLIDP